MASNSSEVAFSMEDSFKLISKGVMMGAAIMFTAIRREHASYNYVTLALFGLATVVHVFASLSAITLILYVLSASLIPFVFAVVVVSQPHFVFAPILGYAPIVLAFVLWIIEDCAHLHAGVPCLLPRWTRNIDKGCCTLSTPPTMMHGSKLSFRGSTGSDYRSDDHKSIMSTQGSLPLKYMWSPNPSCVPSSRLSDISLSSGWPESLPSSWGTLTRIWVADSPAAEQEFGEGFHTGCQRARTV
ncbi:hypothetical protein F5B17DRAFT_433187 [Nemania serpens]|nr:hypothetical protein F5B17DRAFT_433187 [Nemania serpens]